MKQLTSYDLFVLYDLKYLKVQNSMMDNLFGDFNLVNFKFSVWPNYLVNNYFDIYMGNLI